MGIEFWPTGESLLVLKDVGNERMELDLGWDHF